MKLFEELGVLSNQTLERIRGEWAEMRASRSNSSGPIP
jgi:hypothetical protein